MKISLLKRWTKMLLGKSSFHVKQGKGKFFSTKELRGYYNDLTNKVTSGQTKLDDNGIPKNKTVGGIEAYFPGSIFQYGLGLYDLFLETSRQTYRNNFLNIADWTLENQEKNGMWNCFSKLNDQVNEPQSAMCQSEGISVLLRAYIETNDQKYYLASKKAVEFMIKDVKDGGTCLYDGDDIIFQEYVSKYNLSVLNGWIFSIFGLYDYYRVSGDQKIKKIMEQSVETMVRNLKKYDRSFWTNYDAVGTIASPAYHDLHIMQLLVLYELFGKTEFKDYATKWEKYQKSKLKKIIAMIIKLKQKILKNKYYDINTSLVE